MTPKVIKPLYSDWSGLLTSFVILGLAYILYYFNQSDLQNFSDSIILLVQNKIKFKEKEHIFLYWFSIINSYIISYLGMLYIIMTHHFRTDK